MKVVINRLDDQFVFHVQRLERWEESDALDMISAIAYLTDCGWTIIIQPDDNDSKDLPPTDWATISDEVENGDR